MSRPCPCPPDPEPLGLVDVKKLFQIHSNNTSKFSTLYDDCYVLFCNIKHTVRDILDAIMKLYGNQSLCTSFGEYLNARQCIMFLIRSYLEMCATFLDNYHCIKYMNVDRSLILNNNRLNKSWKVYSWFLLTTMMFNKFKVHFRYDIDSDIGKEVFVDYHKDIFASSYATYSQYEELADHLVSDDADKFMNIYQSCCSLIKNYYHPVSYDNWLMACNRNESNK